MSDNNHSDRFSTPLKLLSYAEKTARTESFISVLLGLLQVTMTIALAYWVASHLHHAVYQSPYQLPDAESWAYLVGILVTRSLANFLQSRVGNYASIKIRNYLRNWALERTTRLNIRLFPRFKVAEISNLLTSEIDKQFGYFAEYVAHRKLAVYMPVAVLIAAASVNWVVPLILLFTGPMMVVFMVLVGWKAGDASRDNLQQLNRLGDLLTDRLKNLQPLQLVGTTEQEADALFKQSENYRRSTMKVLRIAFLSGTVLEFFAAVSVALVAVYLGLFFLGKYDIGSWSGLTLFEGVFLLMLAPEFYAPLRKMGALYHQKTDAVTLAEHLIKLDEADAAATKEASTRSLPDIQSIRVGALISGSGNRGVHRPVSFELNTGEALLLKGPSGTGKTTLLDTLAGLRTQVGGKIIVNGEVTDVFRQQSWYRQVGYMPQTAELLFGSLRENLTLGSQYADEVLFEALRAANAESLVRSLPGQLDYVISDGGGRLSGGQAQRIALARVFLHQPSLLLLDEPTANLDEQTAQEFMQQLELYRRRGGMVIMSSHLHHKSDFFDQVVDLEAPASISQSESETQAKTTRETHSL